MRKYILLLMTMFAAVVTGCETSDPNVTVLCTTDLASFTVYNYSNEVVDLSLTGPTVVSPSGGQLELGVNEVTTYTLAKGSYNVKAFGRTNGVFVYEGTKTFGCDKSYDLTLLPVVVTPPADPELDLYNDTGENLVIFIDDYYENTLAPGDVGQYVLSVGYHTITVVQESTDEVLYDDYKTPVYYEAENVYDLHFTSTHPIVEIQNDLDLTLGAAAECVTTWVDYDLGFTDPVVFDSGLENVCPNEIGTFSLYRGDHLIEVAGDESGFFYIDANTGGFIFLPEGTTTVFQIQ